MKHVKPEELTAAIRIDGGRRIDLAARREGRGVVVPEKIYPKQDRKRDQAKSRRATRQLVALDGGKEGCEVSVVDIKVSGVRSGKQSIRSRPGTFEWRYGRDKQGPLFHAGSHFAQLAERSGIAIASSADFLRGIGSGYATGITDGRAVAVSKLSAAVRELGRAPAERLILYCVQGLSAAEMARKYNLPDRDMAVVLNQDLRAVAMHFRFL